MVFTISGLDPPSSEDPNFPTMPTELLPLLEYPSNMSGGIRRGIVPRVSEEERRLDEPLWAPRRRSKRLAKSFSQAGVLASDIDSPQDLGRPIVRPNNSESREERHGTVSSGCLHTVKDARITKTRKKKNRSIPRQRQELLDRLTRWKSQNSNAHGYSRESTPDFGRMPNFGRMSITIRNSEDSIEFANNISREESHSDPALVFFTDASGNDRTHIAGCSVVYRRLPTVVDWFKVSCGIRGALSSDAECLGVGLALHLAICELKRLGPDHDHVAFPRTFILTDCQRTLRWIQSYFEWVKNPGSGPPLQHPAYTQLVGPLLYLSKTEVHVEFHWVKGHKGVEGNDMADKLALQAKTWAESQSTELCDLDQVFEVHLAPSSSNLLGKLILEKYGNDVIQSLQRAARLNTSTNNSETALIPEHAPLPETTNTRSHPGTLSRIMSRSERILRAVQDRLAKEWNSGRYWPAKGHRGSVGASRECPIDLTGDENESSGNHIRGSNRDFPIDLTESYDED